MKIASKLLSLVVFTALACTGKTGDSSSNATAKTITDSLGSKVALAPRAERIVTLMPSLGELVVALDGNYARIAGVSEFTDYPESLRKKPSVGPYQNVNLEQVRALKPDLILASKDGNSKDQIERLREWGYRVLVTDSGSLTQIPETISLVGKAIGSEKAGEEATLRFKAEMDAARERARRRSRQRVLLQVGDDPLIVVGGKNYIDEVIELIGAENIYSDSDSSYPRVSHEDVLKKNPDLILILTLHGEEKEFEKMKERWKRFPSLRAVKTGRVTTLRADSLLRPGVRLPEGWKALEAAVFPEVSR